MWLPAPRRAPNSCPLVFLSTTESSYEAQQVWDLIFLPQSVTTPPGMADRRSLVEPSPLQFKYWNRARGGWGKKCPNPNNHPKDMLGRASLKTTDWWLLLLLCHIGIFISPSPQKLNTQGELKLWSDQRGCTRQKLILSEWWLSPLWRAELVTIIRNDRNGRNRNHSRAKTEFASLPF